MNHSKFFTILPLNLIYDEQYKTLSSNSIILYSLILNRLKLSSVNEHFQDKKGIFVHYSTSQICEHLRCGRSTARKTIRELESAGLIKIESEQLGLPLKIYVNDVFGVHSRTYNKNAPQSKTQDKPKPQYNNNFKSPAVQKDKNVSFDIDKTKQQANDGTLDFGNMKNKKRRHTSTFQY